MNINEKYYCSKCMRELTEDTTCAFCGYVSDSSQNRQILEEGTLFQNGRYQLGAVLGAGGFGITYAAWDWALGHPVAIKEYFPESICTRDIWEDDSVIISEEDKQAYQIGLLRFNREARILAALQNIKSVVTVHDCFEDNNTAYIVMEYVRDKPLDQYVQEKNLTPQQIFDLLRSLVD